MTDTNYKQQALNFLNANNIRMRITLSDTKPAHWEPAGHHYRITLSKSRLIVTNGMYKGDWEINPPITKRITFDFWGSRHDLENNIETNEYDVLSCISSDVYCPETFEDFCGEYGYEQDSIKALQTFKRADRFAKRLREFFTESEIEQLSQIR